MPDRVEALRAHLHAWRASVGAQMPTPNPDYDPSKKTAAGKARADAAATVAADSPPPD
jgi:hypothetical protein